MFPDTLDSPSVTPALAQLHCRSRSKPAAFFAMFADSAGSLAVRQLSAAPSFGPVPQLVASEQRTAIAEAHLHSVPSAFPGCRLIFRPFWLGLMGSLPFVLLERTSLENRSPPVGNCCESSPPCWLSVS